MPIARSHISCGIRQLHGLNRDPELILHEICNTLAYPEYGYEGVSRGAFFIYSDKLTIGAELRPSPGVKFTEYLLEQDLGVVYDTDSTRNPNSGNQIKLWTFAPNYRKLRAFARKKRWM